jgi:hypothetical protein
MIARHFKRALEDILANRFVNAVTVVTVSLAVLIVSAAFLFFVNTRGILSAWQQETRIMAYLKVNAGPAARHLKHAIEAIEGVRQARFIARDEALRDLKAQMPHQASLFENLEENPLPDAFEIELKPAAEGWDRINAIASGSARSRDRPSIDRKWVEPSRGSWVCTDGGSAMIACSSWPRCPSLPHRAAGDLLAPARSEIMRLVGAAEGSSKPVLHHRPHPGFGRRSRPRRPVRLSSTRSGTPEGGA